MMSILAEVLLTLLPFKIATQSTAVHTCSVLLFIDYLTMNIHLISWGWLFNGTLAQKGQFVEC